MRRLRLPMGALLLFCCIAVAQTTGRPDKRADCLAMAAEASKVANFLEANWLPNELEFRRRTGLQRGYQLAVRGSQDWVVRITDDRLPLDVFLVETTLMKSSPGVPQDLKITLTQLSRKDCCSSSYLLVACSADGPRIVDVR